MLPDCRTVGEGFSIPPVDWQSSDVAGCLDAWREFQRVFHACLARSESREHFLDDMAGPCSPLARQSIAPRALPVEGGTSRGMQRCLSDVLWEEEQMRWNYRQLVADAMGTPDGVLMVDETGFMKKGKDSVGVARQYCGALGKGDHCQVGVFAGDASRQGYAVVDTRLFMPESWLGTDYADKRAKCKVPEAVTFQTKPQLAAAMLQAIVQEGILPFKYLVADGLYGNSPDFVDAGEACGGTTALVALSSETRCWLQRPQTEEQTYRDKGAGRSQRRVGAAATVPGSVAALATSLPASRWYRHQVAEGTKGPITDEFARHRVTLCKDGVPDRTVWLVITRTLGAEPTYTYASSQAPARIPFSTLVWLSGVRWAIEQCFAEGKTALGMDHDAGRKYPGWQHHMLTSMLAHFFLWHLKMGAHPLVL